MNIKKKDHRLPFLHEFKFWHNAPKLLPISRKHGEKVPLVIAQYEAGFRNSLMVMRAFKMEKVKTVMVY